MRLRFDEGIIIDGFRCPRMRINGEEWSCHTQASTGGSLFLLRHGSLRNVDIRWGFVVASVDGAPRATKLYNSTKINTVGIALGSID